eukprot:636500-Rhodomonas_salina.3
MSTQHPYAALHLQTRAQHPRRAAQDTKQQHRIHNIHKRRQRARNLGRERLQLRLIQHLAPPYARSAPDMA